jgi:hypothetical protein
MVLIKMAVKLCSPARRNLHSKTFFTLETRRAGLYNNANNNIAKTRKRRYLVLRARSHVAPIRLVTFGDCELFNCECCTRARQRVNASQRVYTYTKKPTACRHIKQSPLRQNVFLTALGWSRELLTSQLHKAVQLCCYFSTLTLLWNIKLDLLLRLPHCPCSFPRADPISKCDTVYDALNCDASAANVSWFLSAFLQPQLFFRIFLLDSSLL